MPFFRKLTDSLHKMEPLTVALLTDGFRLACGLLILAIALVLLLGRVGDYVTMLSCIKGAFTSALGVFDATVIACLLGDLYIKERRQA